MCLRTSWWRRRRLALILFASDGLGITEVILVNHLFVFCLYSFAFGTADHGYSNRKRPFCFARTIGILRATGVLDQFTWLMTTGLIHTT